MSVHHNRLYIEGRKLVKVYSVSAGSKGVMAMLECMVAEGPRSWPRKAMQSTSKG